MATGADRARASRIRAKGSNATADETAWLDDFERSRGKALAPAPVKTPSTVTRPIAAEEALPAEIVEQEMPPLAPPADQPSFDSEDIGGEPDRVIFYDDAALDKPPVKSEETKITGFIATSTASSVFLLNKTGWSIFGDREHVEPTTEEMELMTKVIGSYAERYGWTRELDDALLLGTVLIAYNARCFRAPKKGTT